MIKTINIIVILFIISCLYIINNKNNQIKHYQSVLSYYQWHNVLFDEPEHSGKYLIQINNNINKTIFL